jgi:hypothetical protein
VRKYRLIKQIASGGFADVWEAEHLETGRRVALKMMTSLRASSAEALGVSDGKAVSRGVESSALCFRF